MEAETATSAAPPGNGENGDPKAPRSPPPVGLADDPPPGGGSSQDTQTLDARDPPAEIDPEPPKMR